MQSRSWPAFAGVLLAVAILFTGFSAASGQAKPAADPDAARRNLVELLRTRQFADLESAIDGLHQAYLQKRIPEWHLGHAMGAFQPQEWDAAAALDAWVQRSPHLYQPYLARGLFHAARGAYERGDGWDDDEISGEQFAAMRIAYESAMSDLQRALRINPRLPAAWESLITIAGALNDRGELQHNLRAGLAALPGAIGMRWVYAYALHYREAERELEAFVTETQRSGPKDHPSFDGIATWLDNFEGYSLLREREYHSAIMVFSRALERADRGRLRAGRASAYLEIGNMDAAEADLRAALAQRPSDDDYLARLAGLLFEREKYDEAELLIGRAIELAPMYPRYRLIRAAIRIEQERLDEALTDVAAALVFGRYDARVHQTRADILADKDPAEALRALATARRLSPDSSLIQLSYAAALVRNADCRAADALVTYQRMCVEAGDCAAAARSLWVMIQRTSCTASR